MLSESTKQELIDFMFDYLRDCMFGDGLESEYIRDGISFQGLNNMTDQELIDQALCITDEHEEIVIKAKAELAVYKHILS